MSSPTFGDSAWVPASATRNWCQQDPILDWLDLYGEAKGFRKDKEYEGYDPETDMGQFLREKGRAFESAVMACLDENFQIVRIGSSSRDAYDSTLLAKTADAVQAGAEIIYQPVLWDQDRQMFGMPDLLVRSDLLNQIVKEPALEKEERASRHYRVVDIKFTNLDLNSKGCIGNDGSDRRRKAQLLVYSRALGQLQGYEPPAAFILGRGFKYKVKGETKRGDACFDKLGAADMADPELHQLVDEAALG